MKTTVGSGRFEVCEVRGRWRVLDPEGRVWPIPPCRERGHAESVAGRLNVARGLGRAAAAGGGQAGKGEA